MTAKFVMAGPPRSKPRDSRHYNTLVLLLTFLFGCRCSQRDVKVYEGVGEQAPLKPAILGKAPRDASGIAMLGPRGERTKRLPGGGGVGVSPLRYVLVMSLDPDAARMVTARGRCALWFASTPVTNLASLPLRLPTSLSTLSGCAPS